VPAPRASWPHEPGHQWYCWTARAAYGAATTLLATRPEELGAFLFSAGRAADAAPFLASAAAAIRNPALAALLTHCAGGAPAPAAPSAAVQTRADYLKLFGITPDYLNALDFIVFPAAECGRAPGSILGPVLVEGRSVSVIASAPAALQQEPAFVLTPLVQLDAGDYQATLHVRPAGPGGPPRWRLTALDIAGHVRLDLVSAPGAVDAGGFGRVVFAFHLTPGAPELRFKLCPETPSAFLFSQIEIKPDVAATLHWLQQPAPPPAPPAVAPAGVTLNVDALFQGGLRLRNLQLSAASLRRGTALGVNFAFQFERPDLDLANIAIFVHLINAAGDIVLQGDYDLVDLLDLRAPRLSPPAPWQRSIAIPARTPPGTYRLRLGFWRIDTTARLPIVTSPHPHRIKAVLLPAELQITE
jgi:hypothetical protein